MATFGNGVDSIETWVSHLTEPLGEIAKAACMVVDSHHNREDRHDNVGPITFMDEPGGFPLTLGEDMLATWPFEGDRPLEPHEITVPFRVEPYYWHESQREEFPNHTPPLHGETTLRDFAETVLAALDAVLARVGFAGHLDAWGQHNFPLH